MSKLKNRQPSVEQRNHARRIKRVWRHFDPDALKQICEMDEGDFEAAFSMVRHEIPLARWNADFYLHMDNGSNVLAVAHLDTVVDPEQRMCGFLNTADGPVVYSGALDDRLGAYIILDLLPKLGVNVDVLLTVGEESGQSTAEHYDPGKEYNWVIEFDRGGTDVVMYQYDDDETCALVTDCGARVGSGSFSDIAYLEHLEVKAFNWGVGYEDYHGPRSHAFLDDTVSMVARFLKFHRTNAEVYLPHEPNPYGGGGWWGGFGRQAKHWWEEDSTLLDEVEVVDQRDVERAEADAEADAGDLISEWPTREEVDSVLALENVDPIHDLPPRDGDGAYRRSLN